MKDLSHIRALMEKSTKFISISGLSGILAGMYTLLAVAFLGWKLKIHWLVFGDASHAQMLFADAADPQRMMVITGSLLLLISVATGVYLALKKAARAGQTAWNPASRILLVSAGAPLLTGGIVALMSLLKGYYFVLAPCFLIFYGLALYAGSRVSFKELRVLGALQIVLGLLAYGYMPFGLLFFALGFGVLHILYGAVIIKKYGA
ncbi:hypothetical protein FQZ97_1030540 [compost metagenome]